MQQFITNVIPSEIFGISLSSGGGVSIGAGLGFYMQLALVTLIAPGIIFATAHLASNERTNFFTAIRRTWRDIPYVAGANLYNALIVLLLVISVIGIPFAIYRGVQWAYSTHAVILDGASPRTARHVSRNVIKGDWLRTLGMGILVTYVAGLPGPIVGIILTMTNVVSLLTAGIISSLIFAVMYPITIIASTLYYQSRKAHKAERVAQGLIGDSAGQAFLLRLRHPFTGGRGRSPEQPVMDNPPVNPGEGAVQPG